LHTLRIVDTLPCFGYCTELTSPLFAT